MKNFSPNADILVNFKALDKARQLGSTSILPEHLFYAVLSEKDCLAFLTLKKLQFNVENLLEQTENFFHFLSFYIMFDGNGKECTI